MGDIYVEELVRGGEETIAFFAEGRHTAAEFMAACDSHVQGTTGSWDDYTAGAGRPEVSEVKHAWWRRAAEPSGSDCEWYLRNGAPGVGNSVEVTVISCEGDEIVAKEWDPAKDSEYLGGE